MNHYRSVYGLQHGALAHTEQQAIKGPKITSVKPFKRENQRSLNLIQKERKKKISIKYLYIKLYRIHHKQPFVSTRTIPYPHDRRRVADSTEDCRMHIQQITMGSVKRNNYSILFPTNTIKKVSN